MGQNVQIGGLADAVMETLEEYADLAVEDVKQAVRDAGETVRKEIGDYAKSWAVKKTKETSSSLTLTVHSKNRYQLAHLLEYGHAKRGGGRVEGKAHIAPAEEKGIRQLEEEIRFFVTCCRGAITFLRMERSITGSARCGWNYIRTLKTWQQNRRWKMRWIRRGFFTTSQKPGSTAKSCMRFCILLRWRE